MSEKLGSPGLQAVGSSHIPIIPKTKVGWTIEKYVARLEAANRLARLRDQTGAPLSPVYQARAFRARWELSRLLDRLVAVNRARERRAEQVRHVLYPWKVDND